MSEVLRASPEQAGTARERVQHDVHTQLDHLQATLSGVDLRAVQSLVEGQPDLLPAISDTLRDFRQALIDVGALPGQKSAQPGGRAPSTPSVVPSVPGTPPASPASTPTPSPTPSPALDRLPETPSATIATVREQVRSQLQLSLSRSVDVAARQADARFGLAPEVYHRTVLLSPDEPDSREAEALAASRAAERRGQNPDRALLRGELHLAPTPPDTLVVLIGGNRDCLRDGVGSDEWLRRRASATPPQRGMSALFRRLRTTQPQAQDALLLRSDELEDFGHTQLRPAVAFAHAKRLLIDALTAQGAFQGRAYQRVRLAGFSHGAGMMTQLLADPQVRSALGNRTVELTASVDGVSYGGLFGLRAVPEQSVRHHHVWQGGGAFSLGGAAPTDRSSRVTTQQLSGLTHREVHNAANPQNAPLYDRLYRLLATGRD